MADGYTSSYSGTTGGVVDAPNIALQFSNIAAAFHATTGHTHDGTTQGGGPISVTNATGTLPIANGGTGATTAAAARAALGLQIGVDVQAYGENPVEMSGYTVSSYVGNSILNLANAAAFRTALGLTIGSDVQAHSANLDTLAAVTPGATGTTLLAQTTASAARTALGLAIGADVQAYSASLAAVAGLTITSAGAALLDDANAAAQRTTLGLAIGSDVQAYDATIVKTGTASTFTKHQGFGTTTLIDASTIAWDASSNQSAKVTLGGNRTLGNPTGTVEGFTYVLRVIQDATGSRTLGYGANWKWASGTAPVLTTTANAVDIISAVAGAGDIMYATIVKDLR